MTLETKFKPQMIKVFFSAPNPKNPRIETLTEGEEGKEANFQWIAYRLFFTYKKSKTAEPEYFIYHINLKPNGKRGLPARVVRSDSKWTLRYFDIPLTEYPFNPRNIERVFHDLLKEPELTPKIDMTIVYKNIHHTDRREYSYQEFEAYFDNENYIVLNPESTELKNPFGRVIGKIYKDAYIYENPIIKRCIIKYLQQNSNKIPADKIPTEDYITDGFDIMKKLIKSPVKIKKNGDYNG